MADVDEHQGILALVRSYLCLIKARQQVCNPGRSFLPCRDILKEEVPAAENVQVLAEMSARGSAIACSAGSEGRQPSSKDDRECTVTTGARKHDQTFKRESLFRRHLWSMAVLRQRCSSC